MEARKDRKRKNKRTAKEQKQSDLGRTKGKHSRAPIDSRKEKSKVTKEEWREFTKTVWHIANTTHPVHPAVFPKEIPHRLIKLFSFWGETVLDPFAGVGTTAVASLELGRNAICVEQNAAYVEEINRAASKLKSNDNVSAKVILGDSRKIDLPDSSVDLIITSPPYWNKAKYGDNEANLGNTQGYRQFFREITPVFQECSRVLKPGRKLCVVTANVNQYTEYGLLSFPLAADYIQLMRELAFVLVAEVIWSKDGTGGKWGSYGAQRPIFGSYPYPPNFLFKTVHEYILIFARPSDERKKGSKVKLLDDIMKTSEIGHQ